MLRWMMGFILMSFASASVAGEYNRVLSIGDAAPAWSDLPGVDGQKHSLADLQHKLVVLVFTCNRCPVAVDYEDRIIDFARRHADDAAVVAINVSQAEADSMEKMRERAKEKGFPFPTCAMIRRRPAASTAPEERPSSSCSRPSGRSSIWGRWTTTPKPRR